MSDQQPKLVTQKAELERLRQKKNKANLSALLAHYEIFMSVVGKYCKDISNVHPKRNLAYLKLVEKMNPLVNELGLSPDGQSPLRLRKYFVPFESLLGAEEAMGGNLDVQDVMKRVNSACNEIKMLVFAKVNAKTALPPTHQRESLKTIHALIEDADKEIGSVIAETSRENTSAYRKPVTDKRQRLTLLTTAGRLSVNHRDGTVTLGVKKGHLHPSGMEMKILLLCVQAGGELVEHSEMAPKGVTKAWKIDATQILKNIKMALGILPKRQGANEDVFRNVRDIGYLIEVPAGIPQKSPRKRTE